METNQKPTERRTDKRIVVHLFHGVLFNHWEERNPTIYNKNVPTIEHEAPWNKPVTKGQISFLADKRQPSFKIKNRYIGKEVRMYVRKDKVSNRD